MSADGRGPGARLAAAGLLLALVGIARAQEAPDWNPTRTPGPAAAIEQTPPAALPLRRHLPPSPQQTQPPPEWNRVSPPGQTVQAPTSMESAPRSAPRQHARPIRRGAMPGAAGPADAQGLPGASADVDLAAVTIVECGSGNSTCSCPAGSRLIGGGADCGVGREVLLAGSWPEGPDRWRAFCAPTNNPFQIRAAPDRITVLCALNTQAAP